MYLQTAAVCTIVYALIRENVWIRDYTLIKSIKYKLIMKLIA